jgi:hypothetical protein
MLTRLAVEPREARAQAPHDPRRFLPMREDVAASDVHLAIEHERDRAARGGLVQAAFERDDVRHASFHARRPHDDGVAARHRAGGNAPQVAAQLAAIAEACAGHELHREAQLRRGLARSRALEHLEQRGTGVPVEVPAAIHDHVAFERRNRDQRIAGEAQRGGDLVELACDGVEHVAAEAHLVHLVHGDHDARDREQARNGRVPARLGGNPARRVDENDGEVGGAGTRDHVAGVLLVAGRVGDDETAARRGEVAVRHVDGDALLALDGEAVGEEREVEPAVAAALGGARDGGELVLEQALRIEQQPADERALAVVDGAGGGEAQRAGSGGKRDDGIHQKYPSRLRSSIEASDVWSSMRVEPRSVMVAAAVSAMIFSTVSAPEATGHVQVTSPTVRKRTERCTTCSPGRGGVRGVTGTSRPRRSITSRSCA